jgi:DNA repair photolyase
VLRRVSNPPNPWAETEVEWIGEPPPAELEVYEEEVRRALAENESPDVGFRWSLNPYRGCWHACGYCVWGDTPILAADGSTKSIAEIQPGDQIYGVERRGDYLRYVKTRVLAHWKTIKPAFRVTLLDGTELLASEDHRFLTGRGWKYVADSFTPGVQRPHLTTNNKLVGVGRFAAGPDEDQAYKQGYLCGMIRGDGLLASYRYSAARPDRKVYQFRLALVDPEGLVRTRRYLEEMSVSTHEFVFQRAFGNRRQVLGIRSCSRAHYERIAHLIAWRAVASASWCKGFLAGIFDAEGSYSRGILRISNKDAEILKWIVACLQVFNFDYVVEVSRDDERARNVRIRGGLREHLRYFHTVAPAITRKRNIEGQAVKSQARLEVVAVERLGVQLPMYDITTGTGNFIANGVISHNCYARSSHQYWGFGAGTDFDRKIIVKTNVAEKLREEFLRPSWKGEMIAFSGNTDCYQPLEAVYRLTRKSLEVCREFRNPVCLITKGALVRRDIDLLAAMARETRVSVSLSIPFADDATGRAIEPGASLPSQRFETLRMLSDAGIRTGIAIAPVIPGLNDSHIAMLLERAKFAGAASAFMILLRLSGQTLPVFEERLAEAFPDRAKKIWNAIEEMRGGKRNETRFHDRMVGRGPRWEAIEALFEAQCRRLDLNTRHGDSAEDDSEDESSPFRRPSPQGELFSEPEN